MGVIQDYLMMQKKYEQQYGERTIVLMQIGIFYETYQYDPTYCTSDAAKTDENGKIWDENIGHSIELSVLLNCVLTYNDGNSPYSIRSPHKVGFPMISYEKNRDTLLANDFVIVRVDQDKNGAKTNGSVNRFVAEVCSPTTQLEGITLNRATSNIVCVYIEYQQGRRNKLENLLVTTGVAVIDIITGENKVCEFYSKNEDQIHPIQELYRFLITHAPRELIIHISDMPQGLDVDTETNPYVKYLERVLELRRFDRMTIDVNKLSPDYKKLSYQVEFFNKIFSLKARSSPSMGTTLNIVQKRNENIIQNMGLERMNYGRLAYMSLLQHCYSHNPDITAKLSNPILNWIDEDKHLILTHNAIVQLDLVPPKLTVVKSRKKKDIDSLMTVLDHNQTHLGRRLLHTLLQNPMYNSKDINTYYDMTGEMLTAKVNDEALWVVLDRQLQELPDIGRLQRKLEIKLISPKELAILYKAYLKLINIYIVILNTKQPVLQTQLFTPEESTNFNNFIAQYGNIIDFDRLECCQLETSSESNNRWIEFVECPIKQGIYPDLDEQSTNLINAEAALQQIVDHLNMFIEHTKGKKLEFKSAKKKQGAKKHDPSGTLLVTTNAKSATLINARINTELCGIIQAVPNTASEKAITSDKIAYICSQIDNGRMWIRRRLLSIYESILTEMTTKYNFYTPIACIISKLDLVHSYAKSAHLYNYYRPEIVTDDSSSSYLEANNIRHPIIERIIDGVYITNDIHLGSGNTKRTNGMLLFGVNQTGKSSLAKAVALNIIMAQAGCYVPSQLKYKPYSKIITRLSGGDNIFNAQSSFAVEMTELRTIMRQADKTTLVIGDELAHGTETNSGMAIATTSILSLLKTNTSFIFATHMHDILKLSYIKDIPHEQLRICHLSIDYDETTENLIYDRRLMDGSGSSSYGLIVAKSLGLPIDFMNTANEVLLEITGKNKNVVETKKSRYNSKIYVDTCAVCDRSSSDTSLHTHHIIEQSTANDKGEVSCVISNDDGSNSVIGIMHKNARDNLVVLCHTCHTNLHSRNKELETVAVPNGKIIRLKTN